MVTKKILGVLSCLVIALCLTACKKDNLSGKYTLRESIGGSPKTWNVHTWEENTDSYVIGYTEMGLYDFQLNSAKDGYDTVNEMAGGKPVDVTADYAGKYNVPSGESQGYAFKIPLNNKAVWANGDVINADTYIYSMQKLLDPAMKNRRADSYYAQKLILANAENYFKQGSTVKNSVYINADKGYANVGDDKMFVNFGGSAHVPFFGGTWSQVWSSYAAKVGDVFYNKYLKDAKDEYLPLTASIKSDLLALSLVFDDKNPEAYKEYCYYDVTYPTIAWDKVGIEKTGEFEITLVLDNPISFFNLYYSLASNWIVHQETYERTMSTTGNLKLTKYGTSLNEYMSYGPYILTNYQQDKSISFAKNDKWYGYTDGKHTNQFKTTNIETQVIKEQKTELLEFLKGNLDSVALTNTNMEEYKFSDYIQYTPESYTTKLTFNSDEAKLKTRETAGVNKTILANQKFRHAVSLSIDRQDFAQSCTASHKAGFGLLNYNYVSDPDTGELYRDTEQATKVLNSVYDASSADNLTGYNKAKAKTLLQEAYDEMLAGNKIKPGDKVVIEWLTFDASDPSSIKMKNFLQESILSAAVGTPLEGKIDIVAKTDEDYYDTAKNGNFDSIFSTWGGAAMDPYGITQVYSDPTLIHEYGFNTNATFSVNIEGKEVTKSYLEWHQALNKTDYAQADKQIRLDILAAYEENYLKTFCTIPLYYRNVAGLNSKKIKPGSDTYFQLVAFGGIRSMDYNYDDAQWAKYVKSNNNQLEYN